MNDRDSSSTGEVEIPAHLLPALDAGGELILERACEPEWEEEDGQRERVVAAVHLLDALAAATCTRDQIATLASCAIELLGDQMRSSIELAELPWPMTVEAADTLAESIRDRAELMRELTQLRDAVGGSPPTIVGDVDAPEV